MKILLALAVALSTGGCSIPFLPKQESEIVDTFCLTSKKRQWSINDSVQSIHDAEVWNATIDRRCGVPKPSA